MGSSVTVERFFDSAAGAFIIKLESAPGIDEQPSETVCADAGMVLDILYLTFQEGIEPLVEIRPLASSC